MEGATSYKSLRIVALCLLATGGCTLTGKRTVWREPVLAAPSPINAASRQPMSAEAFYAAGVQAESKGSACCVDYYYQAAVSSWPCLEQELAASHDPTDRSADLYRSSVTKLLTSAQQHGRWIPGCGMQVSTQAGEQVLPAQFQGFVWRPEDFQLLVPCGDYCDPGLHRLFRNGGLGVPLVTVRHTNCPQPFTRRVQTFSATALLRPNDGGAGYHLEFYDPLRVSSTIAAGRQIPLARDLSAPIAYADQGEDRQWITSYLQPGRPSDRDGLFMLEPYQPGKIPVVLIHGLLSDPKTWANMTNELRNQPCLNDRYQWWGYHYATGEPFLQSAAVLRRQLAEIRQTYDPTRSDPALSQMVLIGHSMGGLVAKLQVTHSGDKLWRSVAREPFTSLRADAMTRGVVRNQFFFQPSQDVTRVVFAGTPHLGSPWARRPVGRLASALVRPSADREAAYKQLIEDNPNFFTEELSQRLPTSIDMLEPSSLLLAATTTLPFPPRVQLHSIVGVGQARLDGEPSDGVVPVNSARLCRVDSERDIDAKHTELNKDANSVAEIECILFKHLRENGAHVPRPRR